MCICFDIRVLVCLISEPVTMTSPDGRCGGDLYMELGLRPRLLSALIVCRCSGHVLGGVVSG